MPQPDIGLSSLITYNEQDILTDGLELQRSASAGRRTLIDDAELARQSRMRDRFFDLYVNVPMQKVVTDRLRPAGKNDQYGVE